ncbi:hypothetical protein N2152v2_006050 [Parachlorella kessleri]
MADTVRYLLEEMVPELEDMEQRGYFSRHEIKQIVQKRQDFEYSLKRRAGLKEDYLRYIEYETRLEQLRQHRRKERGITGKKSLADYAIVRRVHFIYERATRKFRGDLGLWSRWLAFCQRTGSSRQMSRALTKALQLHPTAPALWTYAAAWEFEHNLNAAAARALMQRGLRMCKDAPALWHEYFRMELLYAMRLRERRRVLGIDDVSLGNGQPTEQEHEQEQQQEGEEDVEGAKDGPGDESAAAVKAVLNGAVAAVVYRSAVKAVPGSVDFRRKFLDILRPFDFPGKAGLQELVYTSVAADFADSGQAWDLRARRHIDSCTATADGEASEAAQAEAVQAAIATYQEAVQTVPTAEMYSLFAAFLRERLQGLLERVGSQQQAKRAQQRRQQAEGLALTRTLLEVCGQAAKARCLTEDMALQWPKLHLRCGNPAAALEAARSAAATLPRSPATCQQLVGLEACQLAQEAQLASSSAAGSPPVAGSTSSSSDSGSSSDKEEELRGANVRQHQAKQLERVVLEALGSVPVEAAGELWLLGLQALVGGGAPLGGLCWKLEEAVAGLPRGPVQGGMGAVAAAVLSALERTRGLGAARKLYRKLLKLPAPGAEFFHAILGMELLAGEAQADACGGTESADAQRLSAKQLRDVFEAAVDAYGEHDWRLWLRYLQFEQQHGKGAGQVYWRAVKALADPELFITECQRQKLQQ